MKHYIDKDALVAEIERRMKAIRTAFSMQGILHGHDRAYASAQYDAFNSLLSFLDTLEVKDVDLDFTAIAMPSDSSIWVNHDDLPCLEDGDNVEILIIKK